MTKPEIPEGYYQLEPNEIKEPLDLVWDDYNGGWSQTASPDLPVGTEIITIRKLTYPPILGEHQELPKGYRLLKPGEITQKEDLYWSDLERIWKPSQMSKGKIIGSDGYVQGAHNVKLYCRKTEVIAEPKAEPKRNPGYGSW